MFPWCVGFGNVKCCDVMQYDVTWLVARWDEEIWLAVNFVS